MVDMLRLLAAETAADVTTEAAKGTVPAENIEKMWSTLVTGLVVVFLILILLVIVLWALGKVMNIKRKPKNIEKTEAASVPAASAVPVQEAAVEAADEYEEDDGEIIAVIAAAIAAYGESEGKQYKIASVKRKEKALRSNWASAGIAENTRPF